MPRYTRSKTCLVKTEVTYGTDPVPAGVTDALLCRDDVKVMPVKNVKVGRNVIQSYIGNSADVIIGTNMEFEIAVEAQASGTLGTKPGLALDALLQAAGMAATVVAVTSVTYNLISSAFPSATIYFNRAGLLYKLLGCRVTSLDINFTPLGIPYFVFKGLGLYGGLADAALPAVTLTAYKAPQGVNNANTSAFTLGGFAGLMYEFKATLSNKTKYRNLVGVEDIILTDRSGSCSIELEEPTIAAKDFYAVARAGTIITSSITHGSVAGSKVKCDLNLQLTDPTPGDRDGVASIQVGGDLTPVNGNDELILTFI